MPSQRCVEQVQSAERTLNFVGSAIILEEMLVPNLRLTFALGAVLCPAVLASACAERESALEQADGPLVALSGVRRIVMLGDSITEGGSGPGGYVRLVQDKLTALNPRATIVVVNAGISGHKSTDMAARFQKDVLDRSPHVVTINVGVNDVWHAFHDWSNNTDHPNGDLPAGVPVDLYRAKIKEMVTAARASGIRVILVSPTLVYEKLTSPENVRATQFTAAMKALAKSLKCGFVDLNTPFHKAVAAHQKAAPTAGLLLTTDGVHMNGAGNRLMAREILKGLGVPVGALGDLKP